MKNLNFKSLKVMGMAIQMLQNELQQLQLMIQEGLKEQVQDEIKKSAFSNDEFLTANQVCETFKISLSTLERYVRDGLKFSSKEKGCKRLFKRSDVETFKKIKNGR